MTGVSGEDITALLAQGDLRAFLRAQEEAATPAPQLPPAENAPPPRRPGAWPTGSTPPAPAPDLPEAVVTEAVAEYRRWKAAGEPEGDYRCDCQPCRLLYGPA